MMIHKNESQYSRLIIAIVGPTKNSVKFAPTQSKNLKKRTSSNREVKKMFK